MTNQELLTKIEKRFESKEFQQGILTEKQLSEARELIKTLE